MSVNFCVAVAKLAMKENYSGCGFGSATSEKSIATITLGSLKPSFETCEPGVFKERLKAALELSDQEDDIWRWRTIYALSQDESLVCINFIPMDPSQAQIAHVMRTKKNEDEIRSYRLYYHDLHQIKYLLPVEQPSQVYQISTPSSFRDIKGTQLELALDFFAKDVRSQGLALTFEDDKGKLTTLVWLKS